MKNVFKICIAILTLLFYSCGKNSTEDDSTENDICNKFFLDNAIIDTLMINKDKHSFVNSDGYPFYDSILTSLQDRHVYKIKMIKNIEYRISASQPNTISSQINLTLINNKCDTLASSKVENSQKSKLIIKSPETADYYLIVKLFPGSNPTFGYRLNFEELFENEISFSGFDWFCDGTWDISNSNTASLTHHDSFIYRHLILKSTGTENPDLSFVIQSNSTIHPSFG